MENILLKLTVTQGNRIIDTAEVFTQDDRYYLRMKRLKLVHMITEDEYNLLKWQDITIGRNTK